MNVYLTISILLITFVNVYYLVVLKLKHIFAV